MGKGSGAWDRGDRLQVLGSLHARFERLFSGAELKRVVHEEAVKREVLSLLEAVCGVVDASRADNSTTLFQFLRAPLHECTNILGASA